MARMYPRTLDAAEVKSEAELKVFDALASSSTTSGSASTRSAG